MLQAATIQPNYYLYPGMLFAEPGSHSVTTVLGSCVSVCVWDPCVCMGGINHYLLPFWNGDGLKVPRYGNIAIPMLIERLLDLGCRKARMKAKVFGGGKVLENSGVMNIGEKNILFAQNALQEAGIPIIGMDVGGTQGRKITFLTATGEVYVRKIGRNDDKR